MKAPISIKFNRRPQLGEQQQHGERGRLAGRLPIRACLTLPATGRFAGGPVILMFFEHELIGRVEMSW